MYDSYYTLKTRQHELMTRNAAIVNIIITSSYLQI